MEARFPVGGAVEGGAARRVEAAAGPGPSPYTGDDAPRIRLHPVDGEEHAPCVAVGTDETLPLLERQLALLAGGPRPARGVVVGRDDLAAACAETGAVVAFVSLPGRAGEAIARVRSALRAAGVIERFVPPLDELLGRSAPALSPAGAAVAGRGLTGEDLAALVGREPRPVDRESIGGLIGGRCVLVTGAGGSIGSELARLVCGFGPSELVLMERGENALFEIDRWVASRHPEIRRAALLHDVTESERTAELVERHRPAVVFHAAAHKHVPLMEDHPAHAAVNNVLGTKAIADAAVASGASRFVLISSDKAVRPSSVMGATKRMAEMYCQGVQAGLSAGEARHLACGGMAAGPGTAGATRLSMVRFGNVLGSAGSVLPIWSAQIGDGGPMTVTDERMTRYFMTIPEAAALVIQAAALAGDPLLTGRADPGSPAEVFVLDMGEPVRVVDLAERFASRHGLRAVLRRGEAVPVGQGLDPVRGAIDVVVSGARPGEKLHEELAYAAEHLRRTAHPAINALASPRPPTAEDAGAMIDRVRSAAASGSREAVLNAIGRWVPELGRRLEAAGA